MPSVKPEIMVWARKAAGLTLEEAAKKLGFQDSNRSTAAEKLAARMERKIQDAVGRVWGGGVSVVPMCTT